MSEIIGYKCKICGQRMDIHGCGEHRQATDHENFEPIEEKPSETKSGEMKGEKA